ncbi:MAG: 4Fe-4S binding protein [Deltaproteobacteria bacterium]|jgi:heterodisulfide reductase subunit A|nr:4Fe-4S binding protein [Deltaproteobacteria bacterium]
MRRDGSALPVLVIGGGVAGMQAALDLANAGTRVVLAEKEGNLGGQVMRLDKVYPTDHCAFCPTWTHARACREHPLITVAINTTVLALENNSYGSIRAVLRREAPPVDPQNCVFCGLCEPVCPKKAVMGRPPDLPWDPSAPPVAYIDLSRCDQCGACVKVCPTRAIDFTRLPAEERLEARDCIVAGGFFEPRPAPAPEYGAHGHPDILTAMAFEKWSAEFNNPDGNAVPCRPSDGGPIRRLAFIQCAGARDRRELSYCAAVCCMHAAKQALWFKSRRPETDIVIFYTDMRAPGKAQEAYVQRAREAGIRFIRRRPGLVTPLAPGGTGIAVRHEQDQGIATTCVDMLVLNGGLALCPRPEGEVERVARLQHCGFCREPADIAHSVIQAGHAVALLAGAASSSPQHDEVKA